jgi:hypothetical protein
MRETRQSGSEGGGAVNPALPTSISPAAFGQTIQNEAYLGAIQD